MRRFTFTTAHKAALTSALIATLLACSEKLNKAASQPKVTNGIEAASEYPSVIELKFALYQNHQYCTGTFVNDHQVITAAHCVKEYLESGGEPSGMVFVDPTRPDQPEVQATALVYHPDYKNVVGGLSNHDIAIVSFPTDAAPSSTPLYRADPQVGQSFVIVGYGLNNYEKIKGGQRGSGGGIKRRGSNQVAAVKDGLIEFFGVTTATSAEAVLGQKSASGSGDSGGPLLINDALAATTAGGGIEDVTDASGHTTTVKVSKYVNLNEAENQAFLAHELDVNTFD